MQLNHLPIEFSAEEFTGYATPYENADSLQRIRRELMQTHFCHRDGERVLIFPYHKDIPTPGSPERFGVATHHGIANALARNARPGADSQHTS
jgi:hypothetical protein